MYIHKNIANIVFIPIPRIQPKVHSFQRSQIKHSSLSAPLLCHLPGLAATSITLKASRESLTYWLTWIRISSKGP